MDEWMILYDDTEATSTRFLGVAGETTRFDVAITTTAHFYGKKLVTLIQSGRTAILGEDEASHASYLMEAFQLRSEEEAEELSRVLRAHW
ncbi:hypothetical protein GCM10010885_03190 [Alicyclobacillus cellulosilyticus]|uniref:DUF3055 family protein n=1 Tax=Alicyclobacillus cellulosilyticus TaxID=1003997 RepID=A0A917K210_9BACL|nr:DUF3055 domain-containing protein [Alicyclobacillus cellulosilyticus]GGI96986.1 hypothetical protein GCM10010885_03190 [Alicyclobacillus cellulosilyticus]